MWSAGAFVFYLITHGHYVYANRHNDHSDFLGEISQLLNQKDDEFLHKCMYRQLFLAAATKKKHIVEPITQRIAHLSRYPESGEKLFEFWHRVFSIQRPSAKEMLPILFDILFV